MYPFKLYSSLSIRLLSKMHGLSILCTFFFCFCFFITGPVPSFSDLWPTSLPHPFYRIQSYSLYIIRTPLTRRHVHVHLSLWTRQLLLFSLVSAPTVSVIVKNQAIYQGIIIIMILIGRKKQKQTATERGCQSRDNCKYCTFNSPDQKW